MHNLYRTRINLRRFKVHKMYSAYSLLRAEFGQDWLRETHDRCCAVAKYDFYWLIDCPTIGYISTCTCKYVENNVVRIF